MIYIGLVLNFILIILLYWKIKKQDYFIGNAAYKARSAEELVNKTSNLCHKIMRYFNLEETYELVKKGKKK